MWPFKKNKQKEPKKKVYTFGVEEMTHIGERYEYKVTAENKKEAFNKLVKNFFGTREERVLVDKDIEANSWNIHSPNKAEFICWGMPYWFAKRISGIVRGPGFDFDKKLKKYAIDHDIDLDRTS